MPGCLRFAGSRAFDFFSGNSFAVADAAASDGNLHCRARKGAEREKTGFYEMDLINAAAAEIFSLDVMMLDKAVSSAAV